MTGHGHPKPIFGCPECIALAMRGTADVPPGEIPAGWGYYRVDVTRYLTSYYYVLAPSKQAAEEDAKEIHLVDGDYRVDDEDAFVSKSTPKKGEPLWTGGPDGEWTEVKETA